MRVALVLVLGLVFAAGLGLAAHLIARDTVALPVASIEAGEGLAPVRAGRTASSSARTTSTARTATSATTSTATSTETEPDDDRGRGRGRNRGRGGGDNSGKGGDD
jgi:hypothetical protein